jgi:glycosyltransferase involved in cell wall biosynthesis
MHDPVRNYIVGPRWWHRRCIASAYSFLREVFVHQPIVLDTVRPMPHLKTTVVPHGPYTFPAATVGREKYRGQLGLPVTAPVWLSFGHIRDGKNLDLVIRALVHFPEAFLVVAGQEQSSGQKRVAFYRALARQCGVDRRCLWLNRFIAPEEVGNLFTACDLVMVTYNQNFHSASGVLNIAVSFRKPCLASGGSSNLQAVVSQYGLGIWVEPDREDALVEGLRRWQAAPPVPRWDLYAAENSWRRNAEIVRDRIFASDVCPVPSA